MCAISQVYIGKAEIKNGITFHIVLDKIFVCLFQRTSVLVKIDGHVWSSLSNYQKILPSLTLLTYF